ncbi:MAG: hypothetical protein WAO78_15915 [Roseovarius sp.]
MPQIFLPQEAFEEVDIYTGKYAVRYRIISDNKNNFSNWSPIFEVDPEYVYQRGTLDTPGYMFLDKIGNDSVNIIWDPVSKYKILDDGSFQIVDECVYYDLWVRWAGNGGNNPSDWIYRQRVVNTSININIPAEYVDSTGVTRPKPKYMYAEIYRPGRPIIRYDQTYEFPQNSSTVDIVNDVIDFGAFHGSSTGTPGLYLSATPIGGLVNNTTYYTRTINYTTIALYSTRQDSLDDVNRKNLTSTGSGTGSFTGYPLRMYDNLITTL